ncbi:MAG TPA: GspE/PulE family protein [Candidatus Paceibacterota bacterium]|nr:GspE/PulE family protein [Candidatus Paceibacterota bacterium]
MPDQTSADLQKKLAHIRRDAEERDAKRRAAADGLTYIDLRKIPISLEALKLIPEEEARAAEMAAVEIKVRDLAVAAVDPKSEKVSAIIERLKSQRFETRVFIASRASLEEAWAMYKFVSEKEEDITGKFEINRVVELMKTMKSLQAVRSVIESFDFKKVTTTELFQTILGGALATHASDIHFEAGEIDTRLRYRLDGLLHDVFEHLPQRNYESIVSRIKLLSGLKINIHGEPQDGRFTIELEKKEIEMRVSIIPSEFGETIVMRILDPDSINVTLEKLGLRADDLVIVQKELAKPNGLILNTGPTGSGKTTTLYAFLRHIVTPEIKIITVEDPIEYRVEGIEQTQTNADVGYTFAGGLRAILRQDPDAILIGEIRDLETADIALQASLTGHMVFSTLHTNSAVGAVPRLIDLGVKPQTIGPALSLVIAQRLVRRLCKVCKKPADLPADFDARVKAFFETLPARVDRTPYLKPTVFKAVGCDECSHLGFRGRVGIYEFLESSDEFQALILKDSSEVALRNYAERIGMVTMMMDGVLKVFSGETSFDEVESVAGEISWIH